MLVSDSWRLRDCRGRHRIQGRRSRRCLRWSQDVMRRDLDFFTSHFRASLNAKDPTHDCRTVPPVARAKYTNQAFEPVGPTRDFRQGPIAAGRGGGSRHDVFRDVAACTEGVAAVSRATGKLYAPHHPHDYDPGQICSRSRHGCGMPIDWRFRTNKIRQPDRQFTEAQPSGDHASGRQIVDVARSICCGPPLGGQSPSA